jgi:hypothetical protein
MRATLNYHDRNYGNTEHARNYSADIQYLAHSDEVMVSITFEKPVAGHGVGWTAGSVTGLRLVLPAAFATSFGRAVEFVAQTPEVKPVGLSWKEGDVQQLPNRAA